ENKEAPNAEPALGTLAHCARDDNVTQHKSFSEHSRSHRGTSAYAFFYDVADPLCVAEKRTWAHDPHPMRQLPSCQSRRFDILPMPTAGSAPLMTGRYQP
ncbi:hypothetical protein, partial [Acetobacter thailandicus]